MDIRPLTPDYAVSPQIDPGDLPAIKAAGYVMVIDNRPDGEIPPHLHTAGCRPPPRRWVWPSSPTR